MVYNICSDEGVTKLLSHLDKYYAVDASNQLDADLADLLDYTWKKTMSVEQYIQGFHNRLDKIATLNLDKKLKGHLFLRQAALLPLDKNLLVGSASGIYDNMHLTSAMCNCFLNHIPMESTLNTQIPRKDNNQPRVRRNDRPTNQTPNHTHPIEKMTFYTLKTTPEQDEFRGAVVDSGACASLVGKSTLGRALRTMGIGSVPDGVITNQQYRFGIMTRYIKQYSPSSSHSNAQMRMIQVLPTLTYS